MYLEIWQGDLGELTGFRRSAYLLETIRTAMGVRWSSLSYSFQFLLSFSFGLLGLVLLSIVDRNASHVVFALYFVVIALVIDLRKPRLRWAAEATAGFYFVVWALRMASENFVKTGIETASPESASKGPALWLSMLLAASFLVLTIYWVRVPSEFKDFLTLRHFAVLLLLLALAGQVISMNFVEMSFLLPSELIEKGHHLMSLIHDCSTAFLYCGVLGCAFFQLVTRRSGSSRA